MLFTDNKFRYQINYFGHDKTVKNIIFKIASQLSGVDHEFEMGEHSCILWKSSGGRKQQK